MGYLDPSPSGFAQRQGDISDCTQGIDRLKSSLQSLHQAWEEQDSDPTAQVLSITESLKHTLEHQHYKSI